jgi:hypothetical protein
MTTANFQIGQIVKYSNGNLSTYSGEIVKITETKLVVVQYPRGIELWNDGFAVGSEINFNQVK